jgi:hypothetical protein
VARTCIKTPYRAEWETVNRVVEDVLKEEGFHKKRINEEDCWKKGTGMATAMQFMKIEYTETEAHIYGWIQVGLGDVGGKEQNLDGFVGMVPKKNLKRRMEKLARAIETA